MATQQEIDALAQAIHDQLTTADDPSGLSPMTLWNYAYAMATAIANNVATSTTINDKSYTYNQLTPSATWNITHNLAKHPSVSVVDSSGNIVFGEVEYIDINNVTVTFSAPFSGIAYLN